MRLLRAGSSRSPSAAGLATQSLLGSFGGVGEALPFLFFFSYFLPVIISSQASQVVPPKMVPNCPVFWHLRSHCSEKTQKRLVQDLALLSMSWYRGLRRCRRGASSLRSPGGRRRGWHLGPRRVPACSLRPPRSWGNADGAMGRPVMGYGA